MKESKSKSKQIGQVFTPRFIVEAMLNYCEYKTSKILSKHVIDNSCGDGAFLQVVVSRYCEEALKTGMSKEDLKNDLEKYIHGIDTDEVAYKACLENLSNIAHSYGVDNVKWDIYNQSSLSLAIFHGKMDYVVGNPPYVRVHNLDSTYEEVKQYKFANGGMTDLYLAFFELGFLMLNSTGIMCYITPSSWYNSVAALNMRQYIMRKKNLVSLVDLGHFQPFAHATAYTVISIFTKEKYADTFDFYTYNGDSNSRDFVAKLTYEDVLIDNCFYLSEKHHLDNLRKIKMSASQKFISVKNGFATLADSVFIGEHVPESNITIRVLKASTGKWTKCLFPYDQKGKLLPADVALLSTAVFAYLNEHKEELLKGRPEYTGWYEFGRTQALLDVQKEKLAINSLCRTEKDFKLNEVHIGEGIYSGLYIVTDYDIPFDDIKKIIVSTDFVEYVKLLRKYKSGGYYTYNSKDVEQYINCYLTYKSTKKYVNKSKIFEQNPTLF